MRLIRVYTLSDLGRLWLEEHGARAPAWIAPSHRSPLPAPSPTADQVAGFRRPAPHDQPPPVGPRPRVRIRPCPRCAGSLAPERDPDERFPVLACLACGRRWTSEALAATIHYPALPAESGRSRRREPRVGGRRV